MIANPATGKKKRLQKIQQELTCRFKKLNYRYDLHYTEIDLGGTSLVKHKLNDSYSDIIAIGGDGTLNEVINGFDDKRIIFSFIPNGSGNDFARNFNLNSLEHHVDIAVEGNVYKMDLGICNERKFINGVGIGLDGQVVHDLLHKKNILRGANKYYYHILRNLIQYKSQLFDYSIEETDFHKRLLLLCIGNGSTFGNGFKLTPRANLFDGILDICTIGELSIWNRFWQIPKLAHGVHDKLSAVEFYQAKAIKIGPNDLICAHIDGEYMGHPPFDIKVLPARLNIRLP